MSVISRMAMCLPTLPPPLSWCGYILTPKMAVIMRQLVQKWLSSRRAQPLLTALNIECVTRHQPFQGYWLAMNLTFLCKVHTNVLARRRECCNKHWSHSASGWINIGPGVMAYAGNTASEKSKSMGQNSPSHFVFLPCYYQRLHFIRSPSTTYLNQWRIMSWDWAFEEKPHIVLHVQTPNDTMELWDLKRWN